jgi:hypothetical protein
MLSVASIDRAFDSQKESLNETSSTEFYQGNKVSSMANTIHMQNLLTNHRRNGY